MGGSLYVKEETLDLQMYQKTDSSKNIFWVIVYSIFWTTSTSHPCRRFFLTKRFSIFIVCKYFFSLNYLNLTLTRDCNWPIFTANETITNSRDMNYPRMNLIYLKRVYTFQSNQITFENPKFSLPSKRFIVHFLTALNTRKPKVR